MTLDILLLKNPFVGEDGTAGGVLHVEQERGSGYGRGYLSAVLLLLEEGGEEAAASATRATGQPARLCRLVF